MSEPTQGNAAVFGFHLNCCFNVCRSCLLHHRWPLGHRTVFSWDYIVSGNNLWSCLRYTPVWLCCCKISCSCDITLCLVVNSNGILPVCDTCGISRVISLACRLELYSWFWTVVCINSNQSLEGGHNTWSCFFFFLSHSFGIDLVLLVLTVLWFNWFVNLFSFVWKVCVCLCLNLCLIPPSELEFQLQEDPMPSSPCSH